MHFLLRWPVMTQWWAELSVTDHFQVYVLLEAAVSMCVVEFFWLRPLLSVSGQSDAVWLEWQTDGQTGRQTDVWSSVVPSGAVGHKSLLVSPELMRGRISCPESWVRPANHSMTMAPGGCSLTCGSWTRLHRIGPDQALDSRTDHETRCLQLFCVVICVRWWLVWHGVTWHRHNVLLKDIPAFVMDDIQTLSQFDTFSFLLLNCLAERL